MGKIEEGEADGRELIRLIDERRAAVRGALDTLRQHGHIEAGGVT